MHQVERAGKQQAGSKASLQAQALLIENVVQPGG